MPGKRPDETYGRPIKPSKSDTIPAGFPGQLGLLAKQMNNGFGGGILAQRNYLNQIYDPVRMPGTPTLGGDATATGDKPGVTGETELDPAMQQWARMLYGSPYRDQQLAALQEYFKQQGHL